MEVCGMRGALCGGRARGGEGECPEWPLYPSQANSRKLSRILCCPYSCFEIVKMTKIAFYKKNNKDNSGFGTVSIGC